MSGVGPKAKNIILAGGLTGFVVGTYFYTMRAISSIDEVQLAIDLHEEQKRKIEAKEAAAMAQKT